MTVTAEIEIKSGSYAIASYVLSPLLRYGHDSQRGRCSETHGSTAQQPFPYLYHHPATFPMYANS
jgi:hypothetical protein